METIIGHVTQVAVVQTLTESKATFRPISHAKCVSTEDSHICAECRGPSVAPAYRLNTGYGLLMDIDMDKQPY
jgi:hypothetical protein